MDGYQVSIVREDGSLAATGEAGEVIIKGESIASGYLPAYSAINAINAINARDDRLSDGSFRTGDIAYQDRDGFIYFQGRTDTKFKVGGHWVHPEVAERIFREDNRISDILITDVPVNSVWSQIPAAMVVLSKGARIESQKVIESRKQKAIDFSFLPSAFCLLPSATIPRSPTFSLLSRVCRRAARKIPDPIFSMPRYFLVVEALPKNAGGKISRQDAKTILTLAVERRQGIRIPLKLSWIIKSAWKPFGKWGLIKLLLSHPGHAIKMLREIL
jgi:acyl-CoA synthetase (AMP-forming)/AMP-acid ligase II